jgi:hypothetical protein
MAFAIFFAVRADIMIACCGGRLDIFVKRLVFGRALLCKFWKG